MHFSHLRKTRRKAVLSVAVRHCEHCHTHIRTQNGVSPLLCARTRGNMKLFEEDFEGCCLWYDGCVWG